MVALHHQFQWVRSGFLVPLWSEYPKWRCACRLPEREMAEIVEKIHGLISDDRKMKVRKISETSPETKGTIKTLGLCHGIIPWNGWAKRFGSYKLAITETNVYFKDIKKTTYYLNWINAWLNISNLKEIVEKIKRIFDEKSIFYSKSHYRITFFVSLNHILK